MDDLTAATVLADSIYTNGTRLITLETVFPRFLLAEVNTHKSLCLAGDARLEFDLPATLRREKRQVFYMSIAEFVDKWHNGAAPRPNKHRKDGSFSFNRQPMRERLQTMHIRQLDETTGVIQTSTITDCFVSGVKRVYEIRAGKFRVAGSAEHRIYTPDGWRTIGELAPGDGIIVRKFGKKTDDLLDPIRLKKIGGRWRSVWQREKRAELIEQYGGCINCGSVDDLHIHHIVPVHIDPSLAFNDTNVTLLCGDCHDTQHLIQGWQGGTYLYGDEAKIDEIVYRGHEMTYDLTIDGKYSNFIANGIVVHNSRNSASSRAIPVEKQLAKVLKQPFVPTRFPINRPGMSATEYHRPGDSAYASCREKWLIARDYAVEMTRSLVNEDVHKQIATRLIEPFMWHTAILSATQDGWDHIFALRCHPAAQPEFRTLAEAIRTAIYQSTPRELNWNDWHLPLVDSRDDGLSLADKIRVSTARCARVSYLTHDKERNVHADIGLYNRLADPGDSPPHASPAEHPATPCLNPVLQANFTGWMQARKLIELGAALPGEA